MRARRFGRDALELDAAPHSSVNSVLQVGNERVAPAVGRREDAVEDDHPMARSAQHPLVLEQATVLDRRRGERHRVRPGANARQLAQQARTGAAREGARTRVVAVGLERHEQVLVPRHAQEPRRHIT